MCQSSSFPQRSEKKGGGFSWEEKHMPLAFPRNVILLRTSKAFYIICHKLCFFKFYRKLCLIHKTSFPAICKVLIQYFTNLLVHYLSKISPKSQCSNSLLFLKVVNLAHNSKPLFCNSPILALHKANVMPSQHFHKVDAYL